MQINTFNNKHYPNIMIISILIVIYFQAAEDYAFLVGGKAKPVAKVHETIKRLLHLLLYLLSWTLQSQLHARNANASNFVEATPVYKTNISNAIT